MFAFGETVASSLCGRFFALQATIQSVKYLAAAGSASLSGEARIAYLEGIACNM